MLKEIKRNSKHHHNSIAVLPVYILAGVNILVKYVKAGENIHRHHCDRIVMMLTGGRILVTLYPPRARSLRTVLTPQ